MVNGGFTGVTCGDQAVGTLVEPSGDPSTGYPLDPSVYYFVQGENAWQAQCFNAVTTRATAAWGDNLTGAAKLTTGHQIRVELGLFNVASWRPSMDGYVVVKLNPEALDRVSAYGTLATDNGGSGYVATATTFTAAEQRVYDGEAVFSIRYLGDRSMVVPFGTPASAEINATGNVVYGYNLKAAQPGKYAIRFMFPTVRITGTDAGTYKLHVARLVIEVTGK
jgi:hypothetical protein